MTWVGLVGVVALGCGSGPAPIAVAADAGADSDADTGPDRGSDSDVDSDSDSDSAPDTDTGSDSEPPSPCTQDADSPAIVIGAPGGAWGDLECDATVELYGGDQGCWHFFVGVKETGLVLDRETFQTWTVETEWGESTPQGPGVIVGDRWSDVGDGWLARFDQLVVTTCVSPEEVEGRWITATVHVTSGGVEVTDTHRVRPVWHGL